jgi:uncharacterized protein YndB with AHSA1/START domain
MDQPKFVYQLYIAATPEKVWKGLTDPNLTVQYWAHRNISDWRIGSSWEHQQPNEGHTVDISGKIIAYEPPKRLAHGWIFAGSTHQAQVTFDIKKVNESVTELTLVHEGMEHEIEREVWAKVLSGLKTLLETGQPLPDLL